MFDLSEVADTVELITTTTRNILRSEHRIYPLTMLMTLMNNDDGDDDNDEDDDDDYDAMTLMMMIIMTMMIVMITSMILPCNQEKRRTPLLSPLPSSFLFVFGPEYPLPRTCLPCTPLIRTHLYRSRTRLNHTHPRLVSSCYSQL